MKLNFLKTFSLLALFALLSFGNTANAANFQIRPGEELEYEVSFFGVKLGKIKVVTEANSAANGKNNYRAKVYMDSYSGIPFVDLHAIFDSWIDPSISYSNKFESTIKLDKDRWQFQKMTFNYDKNEIINEKWVNKVRYETIKVNTEGKKMCDGGGLFFFARQFTDLKKSVKVPTIIDRDINYTYINFHGKRETIKTDYMPYPVRTIYFDGKLDWKGVYGLSGKFEGWFSDDEARIPIKAQMNVYVGSVQINLIKWRRANWAPPKAS